MKQREVIAELMARLQHIVTRPMMFMTNVTPDNVINFCYGFSCAYSVIGIRPSSDIRSQANNSRGWEFGSSHGISVMRSAGLSEEQMVQELLLIEIKMLELVAEGLAD